jgi:hypothetical protein
VAFTGNYVCNSFLSGALDGDFDFGPGTADIYRIALYTNEATLNAQTDAYTTAGEVVASGYTAGGPIIIPTKGIGNTSTSGGTAFVSFANVTVSAALTARGALIYKVGGGAICVLDFGSNKTSTTSFQITFPAANALDALIRIS